MSESSKVGDEEHLNSVKPSWIPDRDLYVVVTERDFNTDQHHEPYPIVLETYIKYATLEKAQERVKQLNGRYGEARIAKLVIVE